MKRPSRSARVYIAGGGAYESIAILHATEMVARELGATSFRITAVSRGSVFTKFKQFGKKFAEKRAVRRVANQAMQAAEAMTVDKAIAENASVQATAIAALIQAGTQVDAMAIDLGGLQLVQTRDENGKVRVVARGLGSRDIAESRITDSVLQDPGRMFREIEEALASDG